MNKITIALSAGVIVLFGVYTSLLLWLSWPISELSLNNLGVLGDSFGALTSLFSGLAFAGLIITIYMQKKELGLQREELSLTRRELSGQREELKAQNETMMTQKFENTFFKMLDFFVEGKSNIIYERYERGRIYSKDASHMSRKILSGNQAIKELYLRLVRIHYYQYSFENGEEKSFIKKEAQTEEGIRKLYKEFYNEYGEELGSYYKTFFNVLKLIDQNDFSENTNIYSNLLRAQLSRYEISLLFYNCLSEYGNQKMGILVKKYSILKHLEESTLPKEHLNILRNFMEIK